MSGIPFTQYFRPDGRTGARWIARPADIETAALRFIYAGGNYTAEILPTGEVSLAAVKQVGGELRDVELIVCIRRRCPRRRRSVGAALGRAYREGSIR